MTDSPTSAIEDVEGRASAIEPGSAPSSVSRAGRTEGRSGTRSPSASGASAIGSESEQPHRMRWLLLNVVVPLLLLAGGGGVIAALGTMQPQQKAADDATRAGRLKQLEPVRVTSVRSLSETGRPLRLQVDGTVVPYREVQIATEVAGKIVFKADQCEAGNYVAKDTLLMRIDPTDHELEVERYTRQQEQAYEAVREIDQEMVNAQRMIDVSKEDMALQLREVDRLKSLPKGYASEGELDRARKALLQAKQQLVSYENQLSSLEKRRVSSQAAERLAKTQLRAAEIDLQRTEIRAPIDGVIVREDAELNSFVARGSPIVTMEDTSKVEVASSLRMDQLYWITHQRSGEGSVSSGGYDLPETPAIIEYELSGRDGAVYRWKGRLLGFDGIGLDPATRTVPVRVLVDSPQRFVDQAGKQQKASGPTALVRGMYVRVLLELEPQKDLVVVPARAMQPGNRVWMFSPDESVLATDPSPPAMTSKGAEPLETNTVSTGDASASAPAGSPAEDEAGSGTVSSEEPASFDPSKWLPGRVRAVGPILPIDSLTLAGEAEERAMERPGTGVGNRVARDWICEDRSGALAGGTLVVVSPLGTVDEQGEVVRAEIPDAEDAADSSLTKTVAETQLPEDKPSRDGEG